MTRDGTLRRSGFARKAYTPAPSPPLQPILDCRGTYAAASNEGTASPKFVYLRSASYREFVASQPCFACGIAGFSQCAHANASKYGKAKSIKATDAACFPLCCTRPGHVGHHVEFDLCIGMTSAERDELEDGYVERMRGIAIAAGRPEFAEAAA